MFDALVPRIYELNGKLPDDMVEFHNISACPPAKPPANPGDINAGENCHGDPSTTLAPCSWRLRDEYRLIYRV
jgi:hypothetical protein